MKKFAFLTALAFAFSTQLKAQEQYASQVFDVSIAKDFHFGDYDHNEVEMASYDKDPAAHALVLKEYGRAGISSNGNTTPLTFDYHVKIKIFDNIGLSKGHVELPFYIQDNGTYEEIRQIGIQGRTYSQDASGAMVESELNPDSIHTVKINKHWSKIVFNLPKLRKGCVIEYKYRFESPFLDKFKTWEFQSDIPKIYSEYEVHIPKVFGYNVSLRGALKLNLDSVTIEKNCFSSTDVNSDCTVEDYRINNVPAFKAEPFINSPKNYLSALYFQLTQFTKLNNYTNLNQSWQQNVGEDWNAVDKLLKENDNFGDQLSHKSVLKSHIAPVIAGKTDTLEKAKAIYAYIQKTIAFNGIFDIYSDNGIKKAIETHSGNSADINLALSDALNEAGIYATPILISNRDNGVVNQLYPAVSEFNNLIVATGIGGKAYLLDATVPAIQFGVLPFRDLNGQGRVIPGDKPSYWIDIKTNQKIINSCTLDLTLDNGVLKGTITRYAVSFAAYERRQAIKRFSTYDDYVKDVAKNTPGLTITKATVSNLDSLDMPLAEVYNVEIDASTGTFNPFLFDKWDSNPLAAPTRAYPIDFGMPSGVNVSLTLHLPNGYTIANAPQSTSAALPNNGGGLEVNFVNNNGTVTYNLGYHLDRAVYNEGEYAALKDFFDKIILFEKTPVTFKK
jgi:hypothetical protein